VEEQAAQFSRAEAGGHSAASTSVNSAYRGGKPARHRQWPRGAAACIDDDDRAAMAADERAAVFDEDGVGHAVGRRLPAIHLPRRNGAVRTSSRLEKKQFRGASDSQVGRRPRLPRSAHEYRRRRRGGADARHRR
jgi:hypothetical protein